MGFETAIWPFRSATRCFYWASKLLSGTFSAPLKSLKTLKTLPAAFDGLSLLCHGSSRGPTSCFCWASKLLSDTSEAPQAVSIGLRNCYLARFQRPLKASKPSQQLSTAFRCFAMGPPEAPRAVSVGLRNCYLALPRRGKLFLLGFETAIWHVAAFDGLSLLCHGSSRGPTSCFCWASKLLSGTSEAPQAVSILGFETAIWHLFSTLKSLKTLPAAFDGLSLLFRGATSCFYWASKLLSGALQLSTAFRCFAMGPPEAPQAVGCFYWASKLLSGTFSAPLKSFKTLKTLPAAFDCLRCFAMGPPEAPRAVSVGLRNCYLALPKRHKMFLFGFATAIWHVAAFDGLSLLCHGSYRGPTSCFCWASKLLSGTSEAPQAVSIGLRNCYLAHFPHPLKPSKASKPSQQLSTAFRCFAMGPPEAPRAVSVGLRNCYLTLPKRHKLFLLGFETAIWRVAAFDGLSLLCHGSSRGPTSCWLFLLGFETAIWHVFSTP